MTSIFTQNDNFWPFWVKIIVILSICLCLPTIIFFLSRDKLRNLSANCSNRCRPPRFSVLINKKQNLSEPFGQIGCKVHIFWEGHKILWNLHRRFDWQCIGQMYSGNFAKFCDLLRINELYKNQPFDRADCTIFWVKQNQKTSTLHTIVFMFENLPKSQCDRYSEFLWTF